jgi:hypothetical protein
MRNKYLKLFILTAVTVFAGCTKRSGGLENGNAGQQGQGYDQTPQGQEQFNGSQENQGESATVPVNFDAALLNQASAEIDLTKPITFKLEYTTYNKSQTTEVKDGKVSLTFKDLPSGQTGELILTIHETETGPAVFRGTKAGVTLTPGNNKIDLVLKKVDPDTNQDTDLTIDVTLDDGTNPDPDPDPNTNPDPDPDPNTNPDPDPDPNTNPDPNTPDPSIASWDGQSFRGNAKWDIVVAQ